jgi:hypothetical protein
MSKPLGALAVVALVLLAGCSGGVTGDGSSSGDADPTETIPDVSEQQWANAEQRVDFETLWSVHADALANESAYEFSSSQSSETGTSTESTVAVDRDAERMRFTTTSSQGEGEQTRATYVAGGEVYTHSDINGESRYMVQNTTWEEVEQFVAEQSGIGNTGGVSAALEWEHVGVEDGQYRFEADSIVASNETSFDAENVVESSGTLVVDETGYVAEFSIALTIETENGEEAASVSYSTTGVGETTVEEPSWTDEAADSSSSSSS